MGSKVVKNDVFQILTKKNFIMDFLYGSYRRQNYFGFFCENRIKKSSFFEFWQIFEHFERVGSTTLHMSTFHLSHTTLTQAHTGIITNRTHMFSCSSFVRKCIVITVDSLSPSLRLFVTIQTLTKGTYFIYKGLYEVRAGFFGKSPVFVFSGHFGSKMRFFGF